MLLSFNGVSTVDKRTIAGLDIENTASSTRPQVDMDNGPFAAYCHVVQNPPCWRATYVLGHPKQRKFKF